MHLKTAVNARIERIVIGCLEVRVVFVHVHEAQSNLLSWSGLLKRFDGRDFTLEVVFDTVAKTINPRRPIETHSHEEASAPIGLHVILSVEKCTYREVDVWSPEMN